MDKIILPQSVQYTKKSLEDYGSITIDKVMSGELNALETYVEAKIAVEYLNGIIKKLKEPAYDEAFMFGNADDNKMYGCNFECTNGATRYDYSHDSVWADLNTQKDSIVALMKAREDLMKKAMSFSGVCDENGEEIPAAKPVGGSSPSIRVTIPRK
jgi:DNA phosphorothioation-dependent restriction protein DptG